MRKEYTRKSSGIWIEARGKEAQKNVAKIVDKLSTAKFREVKSDNMGGKTQNHNYWKTVILVVKTLK